jgi:hypothetical protein
MDVILKVKISSVRKFVIGFVIIFCAVGVLMFVSDIGLIVWDIKKGENRETRLLRDTNYQALLEACRELSKRVALGTMKPGQYNIRLKPDPEVARFPKEIINLEPTYVIVASSGVVTIELHGGFLHYGVIAYPPDYEKPSHVFKYGDKELIDGLWYYDEDYEEE